MNWRKAFFRQASSDHAVRRFLNTPKVEYCHRLHYLQMMTEKLAKAFLTKPTEKNQPALTHAGFVQFLRVLRGRRDLRQNLGYQDAASFNQFIDSLLPLAEQVQRLAPSFAGTSQPNPEYPWFDRVAGEVIAPAEYDFHAMNPRSAKMIKLESLLNQLIRLAPELD